VSDFSERGTTAVGCDGCKEAKKEKGNRILDWGEIGFLPSLKKNPVGTHVSLHRDCLKEMFPQLKWCYGNVLVKSCWRW